MKLSTVTSSVASGTYLDPINVILSCKEQSMQNEIFATVNPPSGRINGSSVIVGDMLYVFGGMTEAGTYLNSVQSCNLATGVWTTLMSMPTARGEITAVLNKNGNINIIGGRINGSTVSDKNEEYNISTNSWTTKQPIPQACTASNIISCSDGKIYLFGGYTTGAVNVLCYKFDVDLNTWTSILSMAQQSYNSGIIESNNKIYLIGGSVEPIKVYEYDYLTNHWASSAKANMPLGKTRGGFCVKINGNAYIGGGNLNGDLVYKFTPPATAAYPTQTASGTWEVSTSLDSEKTISVSCGSVVYGNKIIYVFGYSTAYENKLFVYTIPISLKIRYTLDGSEPTSASTEYTTPIAISESTILKAIAIQD